MTTTATGQAGPLKSDHINYLILRYLQEAGHEASATAFYRDWRRPAEYRDPEDLPFAPSVQRHELVSVIQDGLHHDELISRVRKGERRFNFTTNGVGSGSRPGTAGKGKGRLDQIRRGTEDFPTPPPKRQRKSEEGPQDRQINGAAEPMEVDAVSPSAGDAEDDAEGASPAVQTPEPEIVEVPERYDSMDVAVQTDGKTGPKTSTMYWRVGNPDATILHNTFSPAKGSRALFTAGEGISQFYDLPGDFESGIEKISKIDDDSTGAGSVVTACAWHPDGHALAFAVDMAREIGVGGKQERRQVINVHDARASRMTQLHPPPLLEPQGIVLALRYSWDGSHLLAVRTNGSRSTVEIWGTGSGVPDGTTHSADIVAWRMFEGRVLDAAWIMPWGFVVCGEGGLLEKYRLTLSEDDGLSTEQAHTAQKARVHGLESLPMSTLSANAQHANFDKIHAPMSHVRSGVYSVVPFMAAASEDREVVQGFRDSIATRGVELAVRDERVTTLAFQPYRDSTDDGRIFAVAQESGLCTVYQVDLDGYSGNNTTYRTCQLADGSPALALAWSPEGSYLAVSGTDIVQIWETSMLVPSLAQRNSNSAIESVVTWRRDKSAALKGLRNGGLAANGTVNGDGDESMPEASLSWSADGESLALAVGNEVSAVHNAGLLICANKIFRLQSFASGLPCATIEKMGWHRSMAMGIDLSLHLCSPSYYLQCTLLDHDYRLMSFISYSGCRLFCSDVVRKLGTSGTKPRSQNFRPQEIQLIK